MNRSCSNLVSVTQLEDTHFPALDGVDCYTLRYTLRYTLHYTLHYTHSNSITLCIIHMSAVHFGKRIDFELQYDLLQAQQNVLGSHVYMALMYILGSHVHMRPNKTWFVVPVERSKCDLHLGKFTIGSL